MFTEIKFTNFREERISELVDQIDGKDLTSLGSVINRPLREYFNVFIEPNKCVWNDVFSNVWKPIYDLLDQQVKNQLKWEVEHK